VSYKLNIPHAFDQARAAKTVGLKAHQAGRSASLGQPNGTNLIAAALGVVAVAAVPLGVVTYRRRKPGKAATTLTEQDAAAGLPKTPEGPRCTRFGLTLDMNGLSTATDAGKAARCARFNMLLSLSALDFTPMLPCEHIHHATRHPTEPATHLVKMRCPRCGHTSEYLICRSGLEDMRAKAAIVHDPQKGGCGGRGVFAEWLVSQTEI
jgi:hypothetical protein